MSRLLPEADQAAYERAIRAVRARSHDIPLHTSEYAACWALARAIHDGDDARAEDVARRLGIELREVRG